MTRRFELLKDCQETFNATQKGGHNKDNKWVPRPTRNFAIRDSDKGSIIAGINSPRFSNSKGEQEIDIKTVGSLLLYLGAIYDDMSFAENEYPLNPKADDELLPIEFMYRNVIEQQYEFIKTSQRTFETKVREIRLSIDAGMPQYWSIWSASTGNKVTTGPETNDLKLYDVYFNDYNSTSVILVVD